MVDDAHVPWRRIAHSVLLPNLLNAMGQGAAITAVPLAATTSTGSYATGALAATLMTVGQLASTLPAGWLVGRCGERMAMACAAGVTALGAVCTMVVGPTGWLYAGSALIGAGVSVFAMARHTWITVSVSPAARGRTLSALAGATRLGILLGPFMVAAVLHVHDSTRSAFVVVLATALALLVLVLATGRDSDSDASGSGSATAPSAGTLRTLWDRRVVLLELGGTISVLSAMRTGRRVLIPLVGISLGWSDVSIAVLLGCTGVVDFTVCYLGGVLVDRVGRAPVAIASLTSFALAHLGLAAALTLDSGVAYAAAVVVMSTVNGVSGGLVPTVGSDLVGGGHPASFLSAWRLVTETGGATAPVVITALTASLGLTAAALTMTITAAAAAAVLPRLLRKHLPGHR